MKSPFLFPLLFLLSLLLLLPSCSDIAEGERYLVCDTVSPQRTVLLEEFTGQLCSNCPKGHEVSAALRAQYDTALVVVAIHGGPSGFMYPEASSAAPPYIGLNNSEGDAYASAQGITTLPSAVIDRRGGVQERHNWAAAVAAALARPAVVDLRLSATVDSVAGHITAAVTLLPQQDVAGQLQLWVVENDLVAVQLDGDDLVSHYTHQHVFRRSINGHNGEAVTLTAAQPQHLTYTTALSAAWNPRHLAVVAFVYNEEEGVLQAAQTAVR